MTDFIIQVEDLSKRYQIEKSRAGSIKETAEQWWERIKNPKKKSVAKENSFWALKDVSFSIQAGEVVGVIGRNGAGKSTLLKVLSKITEPTAGRAVMRGRVASLLEVGTGFHPDLTGRENVYLNGAILGLRKWEINRKFEEIVNFSEVKKFIDSPVKHYSSGMYMRLAFAVAAHLDPEILLIDEVLAVGDIEFQRKCLEKMNTVAKQGRTVIFVSHNMVAVSQICKRVIWLEKGSIKQQGAAEDVVPQYTSDPLMEEAFTLTKENGQVEALSWKVKGANPKDPFSLKTNSDIVFEIMLNINEDIQKPAYGISITNNQGVLLTSLNTVEQGIDSRPLFKGENKLKIALKNPPYLPGRYFADFWVMSPQGHMYLYSERQIRFEIGQSPLYGTQQVDHRWGCIYTQIEFEVKDSGNV